MKLYSGPLSLFTAKVRIALAEKKLDYERIEVPFSRKDAYQPKHPKVLELHPKAQVPVLVDGELAVWDSTVILEYLEDRHPSPPLYPADAVARARCRQLEMHADEVFFPEVWTHIQEVFYKPDPAQRDAERLAGAKRRIGAIQQDLDHKLAGREWFCDEFSVADIGYVLVSLFAAQLGAGPPANLRELQAWLARAMARPSIAKEVGEISAYAAKL